MAKIISDSCGEFHPCGAASKFSDDCVEAVDFESDCSSILTLLNINHQIKKRHTFCNENMDLQQSRPLLHQRVNHLLQNCNFFFVERKQVVHDSLNFIQPESPIFVFPRYQTFH